MSRPRDTGGPEETQPRSKRLTPARNRTAREMDAADVKIRSATMVFMRLPWLKPHLGAAQEQTTIWRTLSDDGATLTQRITFEHADGIVSSRFFRRGGGEASARMAYGHRHGHQRGT